MFSHEPISSQILIKQQLEAHYKKLQSAKSSIDNKSPYTLCNNSRAKSNSYQQKNSYRYVDVNSQGRDNIADIKYTLRRYSSNGRCNSARSNAFNSPLTSKNRKPIQTIPGDLLELRANKFTPAKAFVPRMLMTNATSRLTSLDCYNPPFRKKSFTVQSFNEPTINANSNVTIKKMSIGIVARSPPKMSQKPTYKHETRKEKTNSTPIVNPTGLPVTKLGSDSPKRSHHNNLILNYQLQSNEDELDFLNFLSLITSEILKEGSFSNSQLIGIFKKHLAPSSSTISLDLRRKALNQIVDQLQLPNELALLINEPNLTGDKVTPKTCSYEEDFKSTSIGEKKTSPAVHSSQNLAINDLVPVSDLSDCVAQTSPESSIQPLDENMLRFVQHNSDATDQTEDIISDLLNCTNISPLSQTVKVDTKIMDDQLPEKNNGWMNNISDCISVGVEISNEENNIISNIISPTKSIVTPEKGLFEASTVLTEVTAMMDGVTESWNASRLTDDASISQSKGVELRSLFIATGCRLESEYEDDFFIDKKFVETKNGQ